MSIRVTLHERERDVLYRGVKATLDALEERDEPHDPYPSRSLRMRILFYEDLAKKLAPQQSATLAPRITGRRGPMIYVLNPGDLCDVEVYRERAAAVGALREWKASDRKLARLYSWDARGQVLRELGDLEHAWHVVDPANVAIKVLEAAKRASR